MKNKIAIIAVGLLAAGAVCADLVFGPDATMSTSNWSLGASRVALGSGYTGTLTDISSGNPDEALNLNIAYTAASGNSFVAQFVKRDDWTYTPSVSGAITGINFSGDFNSNGGVAISVGLLQGGVTYWTHPAANSVINSTTYAGVSLTGLVDTNFTNLQTGSGSPDFSISGGEITFGYFVRRGDASTGARNIDIGADNVSLTVIPEPASLGLLGVAFLGLLGARRLLK